MAKARTLLAAAAISLATVPGAGAAFEERPIRSLLEARHQNVVMQEWDTSCGAAALATILRYQFADPVTERNVAVGMLRQTDPDRVRGRGGFSLLDMKRYADARGLAAEGYADLSRGQLLRAAPAIVPITSHAGDHFVVFRGVVHGQAVLADPAFGNRSIPFAEFEARWKDRLAFVVKAKGAAANRLFASRRDLLRVDDDAERQATDDAMPKPLADSQLAQAFAIGLGPPQLPAPVPVGAPVSQGPRPRPAPQGASPPAAPPTSSSLPSSPSPVTVSNSPSLPLGPAAGSTVNTVGNTVGNVVAPITGSMGIALPPVSITISTPPVLAPLGR